MRLFAALLATAICSATLSAQATERPAPFDSAHRVVVVTPTVAERLRLSAPTWPVQGEFREARLYSVDGTGAFVLAVQRADGSIDRFALSADQRNALVTAMNTAMLAFGHQSAESPVDVVSEPAGNAFARRQTLLAATVYGPLAASLSDNGAGAGALYLAVTGLTFFSSYGAAQSHNFTRAQSDLAGNLGFAAASGGWLVGYAASGGTDKGVRLTSLLSGFAGTIAGASLGSTLSDAEAHSAMFGVETGAVAGLAGSAGANLDRRMASVVVTAAGALGYAVGVGRPRRVSYNLTAGDIEATSTAGLVGGLYGGIAVAALDHPSDRQSAGFIGSAYLLGLVVGDQFLARDYDLTQSQASILNIGAGAGALVGAAIPVLLGSGGVAITTGAAVGATIGMAALASTFPTSSEVRLRVGAANGQDRSGSNPTLTFMYSSAAAVLSRRKGDYVLAQLRF